MFGMSVSDLDLSALAASRDILSLGMAADDARRVRHGLRTTYLRVAEVDAEPADARALDGTRLARRAPAEGVDPVLLAQLPDELVAEETGRAGDDHRGARHRRHCVGFDG